MPLVLNDKQIKFGHATVYVKLPGDTGFSQLGEIKSDQNITVDLNVETVDFEAGTPRKTIKSVTAALGYEISLPISHVNPETLELFIGGATKDTTSTPGKTLIGFGGDGARNEYAIRLVHTRPEDSAVEQWDFHRVIITDPDALNFAQEYRLLPFKGVGLQDSSQPTGFELITVTLDNEVIS